MMRLKGHARNARAGFTSDQEVCPLIRCYGIRAGNRIDGCGFRPPNDHDLRWQGGFHEGRIAFLCLEFDRWNGRRER